jgi:hypothetical protein
MRAEQVKNNSEWSLERLSTGGKEDSDPMGYSLFSQ